MGRVPRRWANQSAISCRAGSGSSALNCQHLVGVHDTVLRPGPGLKTPGPDADPVTNALMAPHRLLQPLLG